VGLLQNTAAHKIRLGLLITSIGGFLFTFDLPLLRLAQGEKWTLIFARGICMFISISVMWLFLRRGQKNKTPYLAGAAGLAVAAISTVASTTYIAALVETNAANVVFIIALVPVLTAVFSRIFIGEQIHVYTWAATFVALMGVALIVFDGLSTGNILGDLLALVCACCTASIFTIIRASRKNLATSLALGSLLSAVFAAAFNPINVSSLTAVASMGFPSWMWIALNGLIMVPLATSLMANGPRYLPSADVSMFFLLETVLTPIWIWMLFGELPSAAVLFGGTIVIVTLISHSVWRLIQSKETAKT
jgi:drug/metabolite transporter (DMT)-like permease